MPNKRNTHTTPSRLVSSDKRVKAMARCMTGVELDTLAAQYRRGVRYMIAPNGTQISRESLEHIMVYLGCMNKLTEETEA